MRRVFLTVAAVLWATVAAAQIKPVPGGSGSGGANANGTYLVQTAANKPTNAQVMGSLGTGLVINTTTTGVQSIFAGSACAANKIAVSLSASGVTSCVTLTSAYVDTSIALTGTDINTSNQVTVTHLASTLPSAQGGTANGFFTVSGPSASAKTFTFPNASATVLTDNALVTVAQGGTGLGTLVAHDVYVGNGTGVPAAIAGCTNGYLRWTASSADPACVTPAMTTAQPADQTGNATGTLKMNGLGAAGAPCTITPTATGRVSFTISGAYVNSIGADGVTYYLAFGTGAAPANAAAATGTILTQTVVTAAGGQAPFSVTGAATGLALSTATWYDLVVSDNVGGTASFKAITCVAYEQ